MFPSILKKESISESTSDTLFSSVLNSTGPSDQKLRSGPFQRIRNAITSRDFSSNPASLREQHIPEESSESSSSVQLEDSQDILVLGRRKLHGCQGTFSEQFGIKLKKLRKSRYSEHIPCKVLHLQVDEDVQPEIASVKSSFVSTERRERAVSCYTKFQNKASFVEPDLVSQESRPSSPPQILVSNEDLKIEGKETSSQSESFACESEAKDEDVISEIKEISEINEVEESKESERFGQQLEDEDVLPLQDSPDVRLESDPLSRSRSIDVVAEINGKVFKHFNRQVLSLIPVQSYLSLCSQIKSSETSFKFKKTWNILCCGGRSDLSEDEERFLEKLVDFSSQDFGFSNELHLKLLLGAYCKITKNNDWPSTSEEWLEMGFASPDPGSELLSNGPIGLLYIFFLSEEFSPLLQEMLSVCKYFSYEVFTVCKSFIVQTMTFVRSKGLHRFFKSTDDAFSVTFSYCTGMLIQWFELMTHNKDFDKSFRRVTKRAEKHPDHFLSLAEEHISK